MNNEIIKLLKISKKFFQSKKDIVVLKNINLKINKLSKIVKNIKIIKSKTKT